MILGYIPLYEIKAFLNREKEIFHTSQIYNPGKCLQFVFSLSAR